MMVEYAAAGAIAEIRPRSPARRDTVPSRGHGGGCDVRLPERPSAGAVGGRSPGAVVLRVGRGVAVSAAAARLHRRFIGVAGQALALVADLPWDDADRTRAGTAAAEALLDDLGRPSPP